MRKAALMQHGKEAHKKLDKFLSQNSKYDFNSGKGTSYDHIVDNVPYTKYDKPIGPKKPVAAPKPQEKKPQSYYKDMIAMAMKDRDLSVKICSKYVICIILDRKNHNHIIKI